MDQLQYSYTRRRREFGRRCQFQRDKPQLESIESDHEFFKRNYVLRNPLHQGTQTDGGVRAECDQVNSVRPEYESRGMNHTEGGWPRDINPADPEQTLRFKKKIEKDEKYIHTFLQLSHAMEHCILQNNTLDLYEHYFPPPVSGLGTGEIVEVSAGSGSAQGLTVFQDPGQPTMRRPVHHISWCPDGGSRLAVAHCSLRFQHARDLPTQTFIWHIDRPNQPELTLRPGNSSLVCLEYNAKEPHVLAGGMYDGRVACWDTRKGPEPAEASPLEPAHRDPVHRVLWLNSKTGTEFFSASSDGQVKWWDTRRLSEPSETLLLDPIKGQEQQLSRALGAVSLEYEPTIPTRFMVGTEMGVVLNCNRKGKTPAEKLVCQYAAHLGPVYALQRNPAFVKNFLSVGDWSARIWSEDVRESAIISTSYGRALLTDGCWSPTRYSVFFTTRMDGCLDAWDVLQQRRRACLTVKVCDSPLRALRVHEQGQLVATGGDSGTTFLLQLSESLAVPQRNDKPLLTEMLDRETRREKIVEARKRERRVKCKVRGGGEVEARHISQQQSIPSNNMQAGVLDDPQLVEAERHFFTAVQPEDGGTTGDAVMSQMPGPDLNNRRRSSGQGDSNKDPPAPSS